MRIERLLRQFMQDYLMSTSSNCLVLVLVFALSVVLLFYWQSSLEYFRGMPSPIPSLMSLWSSRKRPRLTCVDEVNSHNQSTSCQMISSLSPPSSSSHAPRIKYDVFISFRGLDTRRGFLSHLRQALSHAGIEAYVDDRLREGDDLLQALFTAIEESQVALIIFSKDYASSKWCLEELVRITECMTKNGQIVIPIFYDVNPSDVRHQNGCYKIAFARHEKLFEGNIRNVEKWRIALKKVANLSGFHLTNFGTEAILIEEVVRRVLTRLNHMPEVDLKGLVGIDKPIADLQSLIFCNGSEDVRVIGIWGIGGIGKTTIAGVLYNIMCSDFEGCSFLANVREELEKYGIINLRDKLLSILLEEKDMNIGTYSVTAPFRRRLGRKKILVVLDDVNNPNDVINLIGGHDWLGPGSRIIITTRDKHVICKANDMYEVELLGFPDALQLLNLHAFNGKCLDINWQYLMFKVVEYAKGVPLALKVLGSFLQDKSAKEWKSQLQKLQKMPFEEIQNVLRLSYKGLDREQSSIFLYIACFFCRCASKDDVEILFDACGYSTSIALRILQDRALIEVSKYKTISMHNLIRQMGHEIVREQSIERPWERSHLWDPSDIHYVLKEHNEGTENIESITLDMSTISELSLNPDCFARMVKLKFLRFHYYNYYDPSDHLPSMVHLPEGLGILPSSIRLFHWDGYPSKSFPATFNAENLVQLRMEGSRVERLWEGVQNLPNLKWIGLKGSKLVELPDFSKASSLEVIDLTNCGNLLSIHPSIFCLQRLESVILQGCVRLEELPDTEALSSSDRCSIVALNLVACVSLKHLPNSLSKLIFLQDLALQNCKQFDTSNLHIIFDGLSSLEMLDLGGCHNLFELPKNISKLSSLKHLTLEGTSIKSLPESIKHLPWLHILILANCERLQSIPEIPASLFGLTAKGCTSLEKLFTPTPELLGEHIRFRDNALMMSRRELRGMRRRGFAGCTIFVFEDCPNLDKDALQAVLAYVYSSNDKSNLS